MQKFTTKELQKLPKIEGIKEKLQAYLLSEDSPVQYAREKSNYHEDYHYLTIVKKSAIDGVNITKADAQFVENKSEGLQYELTNNPGGEEIYKEHLVFDKYGEYDEANDGNTFISILSLDGKHYGSVWVYSSWDSVELDNWFELPATEFEIAFEASKPLIIKVA